MVQAPERRRGEPIRDRPMTFPLTQLLRSKRLVTAEIILMALMCAIGASIPQRGNALPGEFERFLRNPLASTTTALGLDHLFATPVFFLLATLIAASLAAVTGTQFRRMRRLWGRSPTEATFRHAPYQAEFDRPCATPVNASSNATTVTLMTERRIGLIAPPLFHGGLLMVMLAGGWRGLAASDAVTDLMEDETLPPTTEAWRGHHVGPLGRPFHFPVPVVLKQVESRHYADGDLKDLKARLAVGGTGPVRDVHLHVNEDLRDGGARLFLSSDYGRAALLEWQRNGRAPLREAVLLESAGGMSFAGSTSPTNDIQIHLRCHPEANAVATQTEAWIMRDGGLLFSGSLRAGSPVHLQTGETVTLLGLPFWVRLRGSHDPSPWLAYVGMGLALGGITLLFGAIPADRCVVISKGAAIEHVRIAMVPHRLPSLCQERFNRLLRKHGGTPS